jgi:hypothetical protein
MNNQGVSSNCPKGRVPLPRAIAAALVAVAVLQPQGLWACAACYGASDAPMAKGLNAGIFSLLAVVVVVLGAVAGFFVYLGKRSATPPPAAAPEMVRKPRAGIFRSFAKPDLALQSPSGTHSKG